MLSVGRATLIIHGNPTLMIFLFVLLIFLFFIRKAYFSGIFFYTELDSGSDPFGACVVKTMPKRFQRLNSTKASTAKVTLQMLDFFPLSPKMYHFLHMRLFSSQQPFHLHILVFYAYGELKHAEIQVIIRR